MTLHPYRGMSLRVKWPEHPGNLTKTDIWRITMVQRYDLFHDERFGRTCFHCGSFPDTVDHVPPKVFLDEPYPDNIITVPRSGGCNSASSLDEQYVASLIEVVVRGTTDPSRLQRRKIFKTLEHTPALRERLDQAAAMNNDTCTVVPELERVHHLLEKIARQRWRFETSQDTADFSAIVRCDVLPLSEEMREVFFASLGPSLLGWGEIGSRGFIRSACGAEESIHGPGREDVQVGRFSYSVDSGGDRVRMIFSNYLHAAICLESV